MRFDDLLSQYLGEFGRYQRIQFLLVCLPTIFTAMHALSWTFTAANVPHRCRLPDEVDNSVYWTNSSRVAIVDQCAHPHNDSDHPCPFEVCKRFVDDYRNATENCVDGHMYDLSDITNSAINRWDIVCDRSIIKAIVQSMYYVGQLLGSLVFGFLGDRIGRKKVFFMAIVLQIVCGTLMVIVPFWPIFALCRAGVFKGTCCRNEIGFAHPGIFVIAVVIGMELVGPLRRKFAAVITGAFFAIGQIILGILAFLLRDYQVLQAAISLPAIVFICYWWIVPESARWLVSLKRFKEADEILQKAARMNGTELPAAWWEEIDVSDAKVMSDGNQRKYNYFDLFRTRAIRFRTAATFFCWPVVSMVYYGVSMNPSFLGGNLYLTFIFGGLMEIPALVIVYLLIDYVGRKPLLAGGLFLASLCMLSSLVVDNFLKDNQIVNVIQYLITKAAITGTYATIYTFTPELFPTVIRNLAMGSCSMIARVGAILASFVAMWLVQYNKLLMIIPFGILALAAGIVALLLPETNGRALPETIEELEAGAIRAPIQQIAEMQPLDSEGKNAQ